MMRGVLRQALTGAATEGFCQLLSGQAAAARLFVETREQTPYIGTALALPPRLYSAAYSLVCGELPTPETLDPGTTPVTGCNAVPYRTRVIYTRVVGGNPETVDDLDNNSYQGPILDTIITPTSPGGGIGNTFVVQTVTSQGTFTIISNPFTDPGTTAEVQSVTYERVDGQPDNCGPPIPPPPLTPAERVINLPITVGADTVNVDVTLLAPVIATGGVLIAPTTIVGPDFDFDVALNVSTGDIDFNFGGGAEGPDCCPETDEDPIEEPIIYGVVVSIVSATPGRYFSEIAVGGNPPIYGPYVGLIRFWRDSGGQRIYSHDIPVKIDGQDVPCPWRSGAGGFVLDAQTDAVLSGRPYFAKVTEQMSSQ